jgi:hypothetical protein
VQQIFQEKRIFNVIGRILPADAEHADSFKLRTFVQIQPAVLGNFAGQKYLKD